MSKRKPQPQIVSHRPQQPVVRQYTIVEYPPCCAPVRTSEAVRWRFSVRKAQYEQREQETGMPPLQCGNVATYQIDDQWYCKKHAAAIALEMLAVPVESL